MPSLYLMRRSIQVLREAGYSPEQLRVLVNRVEKRSELSVEDMQKIFRAPVHATFPDDTADVDKALRDGVPLAENSEFGKSVSRFVKGLLAEETKVAPEAAGIRGFKELLTGT
jgi:pilus assembly protein CpaE